MRLRPHKRMKILFPSPAERERDRVRVCKSENPLIPAFSRLWGEKEAHFQSRGIASSFPLLRSAVSVLLCVLLLSQESILLAVPESCLAPESEFEHADTKASEVAKGRKLLEYAAYGSFYALMGINKLERLLSSYAVLSLLIAASAFLGVVAYSPLAWSVAVVLVGLIGRDIWRQFANPFRGLQPGQSRILGPMIYGVTTDPDGNTWHYARPVSQTDPTRVVVLAHGRLFELFTAFTYKIIDSVLAPTQQDFDVRYHWGEGTILGNWIKGTYLREGKRIEDLPTFISSAHESLPRWPFHAVDPFKKQQRESPLANLFASVRAGQLAPLPAESKMTLVGFSAGARAIFFRTVAEYLSYDETKGQWSVRKDFDSNVTGLILINTLFHWSRAAGMLMRLEKRWFWSFLKRFMKVEKSAYDEMDPESDLAKIQDRARLASTHPKWPVTVFINCRMMGEVFAPLPWHIFWKDPKDFAATLSAKVKGYQQIKEDVPFLYWLASCLVDVRGEDGAVDSAEAIGLDRHGVPVTPSAVSIVTEDLAHECLGSPLIQNLCAQGEDLMNERVDPRDVWLLAQSSDGRKKKFRLSDHSPSNTLALHAKDRLELLTAPAGILEKGALLYLAAREDDLVGWMQQSKDTMEDVFTSLGFADDLPLMAALRLYQRGTLTVETFYRQFLQTDRPEKVLQILRYLDLSVNTWPPTAKPAPCEVPPATPTDAAA